MSNKNVIRSFPLIVGGNMAANITSKPTNILLMDNVAISLQFPVNTAATGQFFIDVSTDGSSFIPLDILPLMIIPDTDNAIQIEITQLAASFIRIRYVATSGTGTLTAYVQAKEL